MKSVDNTPCLWLSEALENHRRRTLGLERNHAPQ
jgi:hypothetical protein